MTFSLYLLKSHIQYSAAQNIFPKRNLKPTVLINTVIFYCAQKEKKGNLMQYWLPFFIDMFKSCSRISYFVALPVKDLGHAEGSRVDHWFSSACNSASELLILISYLNIWRRKHRRERVVSTVSFLVSIFNYFLSKKFFLQCDRCKKRKWIMRTWTKYSLVRAC